MSEIREQYERDGFVVAKGLFSEAEAAALRDRYMRLNAETGEFNDVPADASSDDPLRRFPRMMQPHLGDDLTLSYARDPRLAEWMAHCVGDAPWLVQTMVYFKPPGARGQALHQDQRYLRVQPGTCIAAWMALDEIDLENGCLQVVPGSQNLPVLCPVKSDTSVSFTSETVEVPPGFEVVDVNMKPGDVLFFHGNLIHGSGPNLTTDRFRRIVVGHYILTNSASVHNWYQPITRFDGSVVTDVEKTELGQTCGTFVDRDGALEWDFSGTVEGSLAAH